jgi:hypothetical protein
METCLPKILEIRGKGDSTIYKGKREFSENKKSSVRRTSQHPNGKYPPPSEMILHAQKYPLATRNDPLVTRDDSTHVQAVDMARWSLYVPAPKQSKMAFSCFFSKYTTKLSETTMHLVSYPC